LNFGGASDGANRLAPRLPAIRARRSDRDLLPLGHQPARGQQRVGLDQRDLFIAVGRLHDRGQFRENRLNELILRGGFSFEAQHFVAGSLASVGSRTGQHQLVQLLETGPQTIFRQHRRRCHCVDRGRDGRGEPRRTGERNYAVAGLDRQLLPPEQSDAALFDGKPQALGRRLHRRIRGQLRVDALAERGRAIGERLAHRAGQESLHPTVYQRAQLIRRGRVVDHLLPPRLIELEHAAAGRSHGDEAQSGGTEARSAEQQSPFAHAQKMNPRACGLSIGHGHGEHVDQAGLDEPHALEPVEHQRVIARQLARRAFAFEAFQCARHKGR